MILNGANIKFTLLNGMNLLTDSCFNGDKKMIEFLINNGFDINSKDGICF